MSQKTTTETKLNKHFSFKWVSGKGFDILCKKYLLESFLFRPVSGVEAAMEKVPSIPQYNHLHLGSVVQVEVQHYELELVHLC